MEILTTILVVFVLTYMIARIINFAEGSKIKATQEENERNCQREIKAPHNKESEE